MSDGVIGHYAVRSPGDGFFKVGVAKDIQVRFRQYKTFDPHVELYASWVGPKEERDIKKRFAVEWRDGETYNPSNRLLAFFRERDPKAGQHKPVKRDTAKGFLRRVAVESPDPDARRLAQQDLDMWDKLCSVTPQDTAKGGWSLVELISGTKGLLDSRPLFPGDRPVASIRYKGQRFLFNVYAECAERYIAVGHVVPRNAIVTGLIYGKHLKPTKKNRDHFAKIRARASSMELEQ